MINPIVGQVLMLSNHFFAVASIILKQHRAGAQVVGPVDLIVPAVAWR